MELGWHWEGGRGDIVAVQDTTYIIRKQKKSKGTTVEEPLSTLLLYVNKPLWDLPALVLRVVDLHMQPLIRFHGNINSERGYVGPIHGLITGCKCQLGVGEKVHWLLHFPTNTTKVT